MMTQASLLILLLFYIHGCLASSTLRRVPFSVPPRQWHHGVPRGGSTEQGEVEASFVSVGTIGSNTLFTNIPESCSEITRALLKSSKNGNVLVPTLESLRAGQMVGENPEAVAETLGMVCDILIVWTDSSSSEKQSVLLESLLRGIERRNQVGLSKPQVLVVAIANDTTTPSKEKKEHLMQRVFQKWTPNIVNRLEVVTSEVELDQVWNEMIVPEPDLPPSLVDLAAFPSLLQQVHNALTGSSSTEAVAPELQLVWEDEASKLSQLEEEVNSELVLLKQNDDDAVLSDNDKEEIDVLDTPRDVDAAIASELTRQVLSDSMARVIALKEEQESVWLQQAEEDDDNNRVTPLAGFTSAANSILKEALFILHEVQTREEVLERLAQEVHVLYMEQLEMLRDCYGRQYEALLETTSVEDERTEAAKNAIDGFREAAQQAVPELCREGQALSNNERFVYESTLQGLISDMMEATGNASSEDLELSTLPPASRIPKWLKKVASRAIVLGVNYAQGWLAWQGIRKAAAERDRNMPKFPLF